MPCRRSSKTFFDEPEPVLRPQLRQSDDCLHQICLITLLAVAPKSKKEGQQQQRNKRGTTLPNPVSIQVPCTLCRFLLATEIPATISAAPLLMPPQTTKVVDKPSNRPCHVPCLPLLFPLSATALSLFW